MSSLTESKPVSLDTPLTDQTEQVIQLDNISVRYRVPQERIGTFKEYAIQWIQRKIKHDSFWALKDVNLSVNKGEIFGLIGKNGAGKSTLLKLIARVLRPTQGRVRVQGRVAPLLEVGAGFHPELTGRENIYLNGAMLGFTREEMDTKFQQIVDFAELWDFIDAPLRTYSSGMWARLGFAVATDVEPEILIVDEILSVGDEAFQRKSAERIEAFRERGTTILMVSHNMSVVENMCQRAALLDQGKLIALGSARSVVDRYLEIVRWGESSRLLEEGIPDESNRWGNRTVEITRVRILDENLAERVMFHTGQKLVVEIEYTAHQPVISPIFGIAIHRHDGVHITGPNTAFANLDLGAVKGSGKITYTIPNLVLLEGRYQFSVAVTNQDDTQMFDYHDRAYPFRVDNHGADITERYGLMVLNGEWRCN
jgi:ABC-type polysaccharide/polyol phosphate transport system ATPase subunit